MELPTSGLLVIDKPVGMTSRRAVDRVSKQLRKLKVGHAGTLDPLAEGVLVICVGGATRMIDYLHRLPKRYTATFRLGATSPSLDLESEVEELPDAPEPMRNEVQAALARFLGTIDQRPPAFSAVWVEGKRAYDLARRGATVELSARPVVIHGLEILRYDYPELVLDVTCSAGTYIRSLGRDVAEALGTVAVMTALARTEIGPFHRDDAILPENLDREQILARLRSAAEAVPELPRHVLEEDQYELLAHGRFFTIETDANVSEVAAVAGDGRLLAILNRTERGWRPRPNLIGVH